MVDKEENKKKEEESKEQKAKEKPIGESHIKLYFNENKYRHKIIIRYYLFINRQNMDMSFAGRLGLALSL